VPAARVELAPAKVNLSLRVLRRRPDGYHDIESLVVFANLGDQLAFVPARRLALTMRGPTAGAAGALADNLVLKAARALADRVEGLKVGSFTLSKRLPVAAGLGGGSADAAAALRLLARANRLALDDPRLMQAAGATGADVPVCLDPRPRVMQGIGEILSQPLDLPRLPAVLVNPGIAVSTKDVFAALRLTSRPSAGGFSDHPVAGGRKQAARPYAGLVAALAADRNDLEEAAIRLQPAIAKVLAAITDLPGCALARMSGSGATCFGLFASSRLAVSAARALRGRHPAWWVRATVLGHLA
jgi:4-diphosphocytidyl-2-C-methyl-D-erythritol kinase